MMQIDVRRPMTPQQLAALYSQNPMQTDYDLPPQAKTYVHQQASRMGITSPANHFAALQAARQNAAQNTPGVGWAQQEAAQHAAVYGTPEAPPNQTVLQLNAARYGRTAPTLSALERSEARRLGMTPQQFAVDQRMQQAGVKNALGQNVRFHNATAQNLESDARFRQLMQADPARAAKVFTAVTGDDYKTYADSQLALQKDRTKFQTDTVQKKLATGDWTMKDGKLLSRKLVPNPSGTGEMILGNDYSDLDEFERTLVNPQTQAGVIDPAFDRYRQLDQQKAATPSAPVPRNLATLQKTGNSPIDSGMRVGMAMNNAVNTVGNFVQNLPEMSQRVDDSLGIPGMNNTIRNWMGGTGNMILPALEAVTGQQYQRWGAVPDTFERPGKDPRRMRATLQNNPHFQQLLKSDPNRAMALVVAMQNQ